MHGAPTNNTPVAETDRATQGPAFALAAGLRVVAPKEAEGLAAVLELAIPAQRGWNVRAFPTIRGSGADARVGLSVEVAQLGRAPDAVTAFWATSDALQKPPSDAARLAAVRELLHELLRPASVWVAIRLVYGVPLPIRRRHSRELAGLRLQLGGQLLLYATRTQEKFADGFAYEALDNLERAAELLPQYYRPHLIQALVHERLGWSYRHSGDDMHAQRAFTRAVEAFDEAEKLVQCCRGADTGMRDAAIERLALRRTKCRLLSCDRQQTVTALQELSGYWGLKDTRPVPLYNAACLFAVAMVGPNLPDLQRAESERRAWDFLGHALVLSPSGSVLWSRMMTDIELGALDGSRREAFVEQLKKRSDGYSALTYLEADQIVKAAMAALGLTDPGTKTAV